jgi:hypothetical protein
MNAEMYWFARGYFDGRSSGDLDSRAEVDKTIGAERDLLRLAYRDGFIRGTTDWLQEAAT